MSLNTDNLLGLYPSSAIEWMTRCVNYIRDDMRHRGLWEVRYRCSGCVWLSQYDMAEDALDEYARCLLSAYDDDCEHETDEERMDAAERMVTIKDISMQPPATGGHCGGFGRNGRKLP